MNPKVACIAGLIASGALASACASGPSKQLVSAREAYSQLSTSEATLTVPASVLEAKQALERAEREHEENANSFRERSLAYVAERKAQLAASEADRHAAQQRIESADQRYIAVQQELRREARDDLSATQEQLRNVRERLANLKDTASERGQQLRATAAELEARERQLQDAREKRLEAERRLADAKARLEEVASFKQEPERMVITLDGAVLFRTGQSQLIPTARVKLDRVADMLKAQEHDGPVIIEGHTDSVGSDESNLQLSQARANSVREYLLTRGVDPARLQAIGRGEEHPIASNDDPDGRANNRRVQIIIPNPGAQSAPSGDQQPR
jgi:outer membrane protein OmpA-like peptidoglycan-associated protein